MGKFQDLKGKRFGNLIVLDYQKRKIWIDAKGQKKI